MNPSNLSTILPLTNENRDTGFRIADYPLGYDLTIYNSTYHKSKKLDNGKYSKDAIDIVYRDNVTGQKKLHTFEQPEVLWWYVKDGTPIDNSTEPTEYVKADKFVFYRPLDELITIKTKFTDLVKDIAVRTNNLSYFYDNLKSGTYYNNKKLFTHPRVFGCDAPIDDQYRFQFGTSYQNTIASCTKGFFDIEVDMSLAKNRNRIVIGECEIDLITLTLEDTKEVYTFVHTKPSSGLKSVEEFKNEFTVAPSKFYEILKSTLIKHMGIENYEKFELPKFEYKTFFFDKEINLIKGFFNVVHMKKPDFMLAWNMSFDIPYIIERIKANGYDPKDIMCHPDFRYKVCDYYIDTNNEMEFENRNDKFDLSSYSVYLDQMIQFCSRRKGQRKMRNYRLDYIGTVTCDIPKLDYSHIASNLIELKEKSILTYWMYNIIDTIVAYCIEYKATDINDIFLRTTINDTSYAKIHRQTVFLRNRLYKSSYNKFGIVLSNNPNKENTKRKIFGGFVANLKLNLPNTKMVYINGERINIYDFLNDYDYTSLYPSLIRELGISMNNILCEIQVPGQIPNENRFKLKVYMRQRKLMTDYALGSFIFGARWLGLPTIMDMKERVERYYQMYKVPANPLLTHDYRGYINLSHKIDKDTPIRTINLSTKIRDDRDRALANGQTNIYPKMFDFDKYKVKDFEELYEIIHDENIRDMKNMPEKVMVR